VVFRSCTSNNSEESSSLSSRKAWPDAFYQGSKSQKLNPVLCKFGPSLLAVTHYSQLGAFAVLVVIASQSKSQTLINPSQCCHRIVDKHNLMYIANIGKFQALIFWCMLQSWEGCMIFIISEGSEAYAAFYCKLTALGKIIIIILKLSSWATLEENKLFSCMYGLSWYHSWALVINSEAPSLESDLNWFSLQFLLTSTQKQRCWSSSSSNNNNKGETHSLISLQLEFSKCSWFDLLMGFGFRSTLSPQQNGLGFQSQLLEKVH
jgi:hypothetical protein